MDAVDGMRLALGAREAARAIGVSARTLWTLTKRREIPHVRVGARVVYRVEALEAWLCSRELASKA
jgi:excisionase family DNA binding protein